MNFKVFMEIFGSFNYEVPDDKEQQLFDFYMLNNLAGRSAMDDRRMKAFNKTGYDIGTKTSSLDHGDMSEDDKINYMIDEMKQKLLPELKHNLLDAVFYSMSAELRHGLTQNTYVSISNLLKPEELDIYKKYAKSLVLFQSPVVAGFARTPAVNQEMLGQNKDRNASFHAAMKVGDRVGFIKMAKNLFENAFWNSSYGGPAWGNIAQSWLDLHKAQKYSELFVQIDHIYDLQHNTGTVLNKVDSYAKDGHYEWLSNALNFKANIKDPHEIVDRISPRMKKFAIRAIKNKTGKSWEQFEKERGEKSRLKKQIDQVTQEKPLPDIDFHKYKSADDYKPKSSTGYSNQDDYEKNIIIGAGGVENSIVSVALRRVLDHWYDAKDALEHALNLAEEVGYPTKKYDMKHLSDKLEMHITNASILKTIFHHSTIEFIKALSPEKAKTILSSINEKGFHNPYLTGPTNWSAQNKSFKSAMDEIHQMTFFMPSTYVTNLVYYYILKEKISNNTNANNADLPNSEEDSDQNQIKHIFQNNTNFQDAAASAMMYLEPSLGTPKAGSPETNFNIILKAFKTDPTTFGKLKYLKNKIFKQFAMHMKNYELLHSMLYMPSNDILGMPFEDLYNVYINLSANGIQLPLDLYKFNYYKSKGPIATIKELRAATGYRLTYSKYLAMYFTIFARVKAEKAQYQATSKPTEKPPIT